MTHQDCANGTTHFRIKRRSLLFTVPEIGHQMLKGLLQTLGFDEGDEHPVLLGQQVGDPLATDDDDEDLGDYYDDLEYDEFINDTGSVPRAFDADPDSKTRRLQASENLAIDDGEYSQAVRREVDEAAYGEVLSEDEALFSDSEDSEYSTSDYEDDEDDDEEEEDNAYEEDSPYEFAAVGAGLFLLRVAGSLSKFVMLARHDHPLVRFTRMLVHNERQALRSMLSHAPEEYEQLDNGQIPGVLTSFVVEKLYRAPKFLLNSREEGGDVIVDSMPDNHVVPERIEQIDIDDDLPSGELFVLEPSDVDYEKKYQTVVDIISGRDSPHKLARFEAIHNEENLAQFSARGFRGSSIPKVEGSAFSPVSPVTSDNGPWFCVKMHYYAMYKAFMTLHDSSQTLLQDMIKRRSAAADGGDDDVTYAYGAPVSAGEKTYTVEQERAAIDRILEASGAMQKSDTAVAARRSELQYTADQLCQRLQLLRSVKVDQKSQSSFLPVKNNQGTVEEVCKLMEELKLSLDELNVALASRFESPG